MLNKIARERIIGDDRIENIPDGVAIHVWWKLADGVSYIINLDRNIIIILLINFSTWRRGRFIVYNP